MALAVAGASVASPVACVRLASSGRSAATLSLFSAEETTAAWHKIGPSRKIDAALTSVRAVAVHPVAVRHVRSASTIRRACARNTRRRSSSRRVEKRPSPAPPNAAIVAGVRDLRFRRREGIVVSRDLRG